MLEAIHNALSEWADEFRDSLTDRQRMLIADAKYALWYGSAGTSDDYPGWETAINTLRDIDLPRDLYADEDGYLSTTKPEGYTEKMIDEYGDEYEEHIGPPNYWLIESGDIRRAVFGNLAEYL